METLKAWLRGEPIALVTLVTAVVAAVGFPLAEDRVAAIATAVVWLVGQLVARSKVTPAVNPALPQPNVVDVNNVPVVITASDVLKAPLPAIRSFSGSR